MAINRCIGVTKPCQVRLSFYSAKHGWCVLTNGAGLKCNRQGSFENYFSLLKSSLWYLPKCFVQAKHRFTLFIPIKALYPNTSSMHAHTSRSKVGVPPPCHLPLFPGYKWSHVELNTYGEGCSMNMEESHRYTQTQTRAAGHKPAGDYLQEGDGH